MNFIDCTTSDVGPRIGIDHLTVRFTFKCFLTDNTHHTTQRLKRKLKKIFKLEPDPKAKNSCLRGILATCTRQPYLYARIHDDEWISFTLSIKFNGNNELRKALGLNIYKGLNFVTDEELSNFRIDGKKKQKTRRIFASKDFPKIVKLDTLEIRAHFLEILENKFKLIPSEENLYFCNTEVSGDFNTDSSSEDLMKNKDFIFCMHRRLDKLNFWDWVDRKKVKVEKHTDEKYYCPFKRSLTGNDFCKKSDPNLNYYTIYYKKPSIFRAECKWKKHKLKDINSIPGTIRIMLRLGTKKIKRLILFEHRPTTNLKELRLKLSIWKIDSTFLKTLHANYYVLRTHEFHKITFKNVGSRSEAKRLIKKKPNKAFIFQIGVTLYGMKNERLSKIQHKAKKMKELLKNATRIKSKYISVDGSLLRILNKNNVYYQTYFQDNSSSPIITGSFLDEYYSEKGHPFRLFKKVKKSVYLFNTNMLVDESLTKKEWYKKTGVIRVKCLPRDKKVRRKGPRQV